MAAYFLRLCSSHPFQMPFLLSQTALVLLDLYCKPLNSPITRVGKILPMSASVLKLALTAFHQMPVGYLGIFQFVGFLILSFASSCTVVLSVGGLSPPTYTLGIMEILCQLVLWYILPMNFWFCYLFFMVEFGKIQKSCYRHHPRISFRPYSICYPEWYY